MLPFGLNLRITKIFGLILHKASSRRRALVEENLRHAFPEQPKVWIQQTSRQNFVQTARILAEVTSTKRLQKKKFFERWVEIKPSIKQYKTIAQKGGVFIAGHIGSWEWQGHITSLILNDNIYPFAKKLSNRWINDYIERSRKKGGMHILYVDEDLGFKPVSMIRQKKLLCLISDQYAPDGKYIPFMNRPASTHLGASFFAGFCSYPVHFASSYRNKKGKLVVELDEIPKPKNIHFKHSRDIWMKQFTKNWVEILENKIRANPADYFWVHNRWKNPPKNPDEILDGWNTKTKHPNFNSIVA